jgi:hypothetical protein
MQHKEKDVYPGFYQGIKGRALKYHTEDKGGHNSMK